MKKTNGNDVFGRLGDSIEYIIETQHFYHNFFHEEYENAELCLDKEWNTVQTYVEREGINQKIYYDDSMEPSDDRYYEEDYEEEQEESKLTQIVAEKGAICSPQLKKGSSPPLDQKKIRELLTLSPDLRKKFGYKSIQLAKKSEEVRMQEIEEYVVNSAVFRKINGFLCIWNKHCYKQLDLEQFITVVRHLLPKEAEKKISRFNRFKEAYNFMLANEKLEKYFSDKKIMDVKFMIAFQNGLYKGTTEEYFEMSPKYPILFNINANYLGEEDPDTPYMDRIVNCATGNDEEVLILFYQVLGYLFSQGTDAKKFFVFATAPDSGKSLIGEFLGRLLGENNISTIALNDLGQRFALGKIGKIALNYNMDLPSDVLDKNAVQKIKQMTGDSRIDCEEKFVQSRTVVHHCKFLFASNHPIRLKEDDEAFYRRLVLIPFIYSIDDENKDYQLAEKIWNERHAIATKAAHAYGDLCKNNFVFQKSELANDMIQSWRQGFGSSLLEQFWQDRCYYSAGDENSFLPTEELFKAYQTYCEERGEYVEDGEKASFSRKFSNSFRVQKKKKRVEGYASPVHGYVGLQLI